MAGKFLKVVIEVKAVSQAAFSNQQDRLWPVLKIYVSIMIINGW
jgi:hypothetical protein